MFQLQYKFSDSTGTRIVLGLLYIYRKRIGRDVWMNDGEHHLFHSLCFSLSTQKFTHLCLNVAPNSCDFSLTFTIMVKRAYLPRPTSFSLASAFVLRSELSVTEIIDYLLLLHAYGCSSFNATGITHKLPSY